MCQIGPLIKTRGSRLQTDRGRKADAPSSNCLKCCGDTSALHPLIAFSSPQVTFMDVNLHFDLNNNQPLDDAAGKASRVTDVTAPSIVQP